MRIRLFESRPFRAFYVKEHRLLLQLNAES